jgi:hypothetical protein
MRSRAYVPPQSQKANMTPEERIQALEKDVAQLSQHLIQLNKAYLHSSGADMAFQQATLSLLTAAPPGGLLDAVLTECLAVVEADTVHRSMSEEQLDGLQEAQGMIKTAREEAQRVRT